MQVIILILSIIILLLVIYTFLNTNRLKELCKDIKRKVSCFKDKLDTNDLVLRMQLKERDTYINAIECIIYGRDESSAKVGKIIELSRKRTTPN